MKVICAIAIIFGTLASALPTTPATSNKPDNEPTTTTTIKEQTPPNERANRVKDAFKFAYHAYETCAFPHDESLPESCGFSDSRNGWGATIVDAMDTMLIMGDLHEEYNRALDHIAKVTWNVSKDKSKTFETNIRYLGGLLSAYDLAPNDILLNQAVALADQVIMPSFYTENMMPAQYVDVTSGKPLSGDGILAEFGSLQLELVRLSQLTGNQTYAEYGLRVIKNISNINGIFKGLYPMTWNMATMKPVNDYVTISGGADSFYEYLLKTHILMGSEDTLQLKMWTDAVESMDEYLKSRTAQGNVYLAAYEGRKKKIYETGELICFLPGNVLMGSQLLQNSKYKSLATDLMDGCFHAWKTIPSGLAPESWKWVDEKENLSEASPEIQQSMKTYGIAPTNLIYDLRPETLESLFYFYRITGDPSYQDKAWEIFEALEKYCKVKYGYSRVKDVTVSKSEDVVHENFQESFLFAETFKYLYLIFSDPNLISLNDYVFNTEAHPLKLANSINIQKNF